MKRKKYLPAVLMAVVMLLSAGCAGHQSQPGSDHGTDPSPSGKAGTQESKVTNQPGTRNEDDEIIDWGDGDEIIDPDELEEIEVREKYEEGDWVWVKLDNGNWEASSYKGSDANVTVPQKFRGGTVTQVGVWCFRDNTSVKRVTIPDCVTVVDENCFMGCSSLEAVQMPARLTFMGDQTFSGCRSLKRCVVPEGVKELDYRQFDECESLQEVVLPSTLIAIGEAAFRHCYNLKTIYFRGSDADWKGVTISSNALIDSDYRVVTGYSGN